MTDEQDFAWNFHEEEYKQALELVAEISEFRSLRAEKPSELDIQKARVSNARSMLDEIIKGLTADTSVPRQMIEEIRRCRDAAELVGPPAESQAFSAPPVAPSPQPAFLVQIELSCVQAEQEPVPELVSQAQAKVKQAPQHEPTPAPASTALVVEQPHVDAQIEPAQARPRARKKETLEDFLMPYLVKVFRSGTYRSGKELYKALVNKAGADDSPFKAGTGRTDFLYVTERGQTLADGTLNKLMARVRKEAAG